MRGALRTPVGPLRVALVVTAALVWLAATGAAPAPAQVLTKVRDLSFGYCDAGATYTVQPAENPGPGACQGAQSGRFDVSADPNRRVRVVATQNVTVTNGADSLSVSVDKSPAGNIVCTGAAGTLIIHLGGSVSVPAGLTTYGPYTGQGTITVDYVGGTC